MKKIVVGLCYFLASSSLYSQSWLQVPSIQLNTYAHCLYTDTVGNLLYLGGQFGLNGTDTVRGVAIWDNNTISGCAEGLMNFMGGNSTNIPLTEIVRFQNKIYVGGGVADFTVGDSIWTRGIGVWDGIAWDSIHVGLVDEFGQTTGIGAMEVINGELYVGGSFVSINGTTEAYGLAKFDGNSWSAVHNFRKWDVANENVVRHIAKYNGEIYVAGNLMDHYPYDTMYNICRFNGSEWEQLGNGIGGAFSDIRGMEVYQGKLYVYGAFSKNDNPLNPGNRIAAWNGTDWEQVVDIQGTYAYINDMAVLNGELYVVGRFSGVNGYPASNFAKFDGVNWCTYPDIFYAFIDQVEVYNGEVYISGILNEIPDTPLEAYAKFDPNAVPLQCEPYFASIDDVSLSGIDIYPNPTDGLLTIQFNESEIFNEKIEMYATDGSLVMSVNVQGGNEITISTADLPGGVYILKFGDVRKKIVIK